MVAELLQHRDDVQDAFFGVRAAQQRGHRLGLQNLLVQSDLYLKRPWSAIILGRDL